MYSKFIQLDNLPTDINSKEISEFLDKIEIINDNIPGTDTDNGIAIIINEWQNVRALVKIAEKDISRCLTEYDQKILRHKYPVHVTLLKSKPTLMIKKFKKKNKIRYAKLICEWINCNLIFNDRSLYLSHINNSHVYTILKEKNVKCKWQGCYDFNTFSKMEHFKIHLSFHAYHNQLMNIGQQIMDVTKPKPLCYNDTSARNVVANFTSQLICGWKNCNGEFNDAETFFTHVDIHAIEDVTIPMMSKEKLKRIRYAKCQWVNCKAVFKKKSHLKMHLAKHTQKKVVACPICGTLFCTRTGFLKHCFRQETPTNIQNISTENFGDNENDGILTIDENDNQSSIVIHLPHHILKSKATIINSNELQIAQNPDRSETESNVALVVNFDSSQRESNLADSNNDNELPANNVIQLQLAPASAISNTDSEPNIERKFRCTHCPKSFNLASLLSEHMLKHNKKFICPHCSYSAPFQSRIDEHILFRHNKYYEFKCHVCDYPFKKRRFLDRHLESHSHSDKKIVCQVCERTFTNYYSLNRHVRLQHLKEQIIFACHLCSKEYNRGNNLSRHLIKCHLLKVANGWSRFNYDKQTDGIFRINPLSCTQ